jgi:predicted esterase
VIIHTIAARTHGRYLVEMAAPGAPLLVGFHGYGENADIMFSNLRSIGEGWSLLSIQALHRFYTRNNEVVANWMTRQDREHAIADNTEYVWSVIDAVERKHGTARPRVFAGFSQGVAMAYRAARAGVCDGLIVLAGDVPPDVAADASALPPVLLGRGVKDEWYTERKAAADLQLLRGARVRVSECVFDAGHIWGDVFSDQSRQFLRSIAGYPKET